MMRAWDEGVRAAGAVGVVQLFLADGELLLHQLPAMERALVRRA